MDNEIAYPETDREFALCWRILSSAADHTTKKELQDQMSTAIQEQRDLLRRNTLKGWRAL